MKSPQPVVHVVDDDPSFRKSLASLLNAAGHDVRTHSSVARFLAEAWRSVPGCVLLDLQMPGQGGLDLQNVLANSDNPMPIVFLTAHANIPTTVRAIRDGALDFLTKPVSREVLLAAVERALAVAATECEKSRQLAALRSLYQALTSREREVLAHVTAGKLNKQIAVELGIEERTIKAHRANMMRKLELRSVADLVRLAEKLGVQPHR